MTKTELNAGSVFGQLLPHRGIPVSGSSSNQGQGLVVLAYILMFPMYFLYQASVISGKIEPVLGGYFTFGTAMALPLLMLPAWHQRGRQWRQSSFVAISFAIFLLIFTMAAVRGLLAGASEEVTSSHLAYAFKFAVLFLFASLLDSTTKLFVLTGQAAVAAIFLLIFLTASEGQFLYAGVLQAYLEQWEFILDYQGLAFALLVMLLLSTVRLPLAIRLTLYSIAIPAFFLIGARSEFVGLLIFALTIEFCKTRYRSIYLAILAFSVAVAAMILMLFAGQLEEHRVFGLLKLGADQSALERAEMHTAALKTIQENPLLGNYASYEPGTYAHNILSAWVDLGILGFTVLVVLILTPLIVLASRFKLHARNNLYVQALAACAVNAVLLLLAKNFTYQLTPIALGMYCRYRWAMSMGTAQKFKCPI
jgi:hypothetical protein